MKIGIISDTHGVLREEVIGYLKGSQMILHAGDIGNQEIIQKLNEIAPTVVVRGNNDKEEWAEGIPIRREGEIEGIKYLMVHDKKDIPPDKEDIKLIIFGHSHKYYEESIEGIQYLNPGSCGKRRFSLPLTLAIIQVKKGQIEIKKIMLNS